MPLSGLDRLLWVSGFCGHLVLLGVLIYRRRAAQFPVFTALILANVVRSLLLFSLRDHEFSYRVSYFGMEFLDVTLQLAVVYEVARHVFRPGNRWAPDVERGMGWFIGFSFAIAAGLTWLAAPSAPAWVSTTILKASFFSSSLMSELFLGMIVLSVTVGLPWKTHVARIAHGLGVFSLVDIGIEAVHTVDAAASAPHIRDILTFARMIVYLACLVYWIVTLWQEAPQPRELPLKMLEDLRSLNARVAYDLYTLRNWRKP